MVEPNTGKWQIKLVETDAKAWFDVVSWEDVSIVGGVLMEVKGVPAAKLKSRDIRTACSRLKIKGVKNASKGYMIQRMIEVYEIKFGNKDKGGNEKIAPITSAKRKRSDGVKIVEAPKETNKNNIQTEFVKKKLEFLKKSEARKEKEEERKEKEEERKERMQHFEEWEKIQNNIRQLRKDLRDETDVDMKADIKSDIKVLMKRKKELSNILNFN